MTAGVTVLTGGVGGAKLVDGLVRTLPSGDVTAIINTGDDFTHFGLAVSPDIDTVLYTLSDKADAVRGWGRAGESWNFMEAVRSLGGSDWFALGDGDLALHVLRTERLADGAPLSTIVAEFTSAWGIGANLLPMSDDPVATQVETDQGWLDFQQYFVKLKCAPALRNIRFAGAEQARPAPNVVEAIAAPECRAILIAPSNPYLSIDPILAVPAIRAALRTAPAPVIAVSPLVGGAAVKGPTAKIMEELGLEVCARTVAAHYADLIDGMLVDEHDPPAELDIEARRADTLMKTAQDRVRVAKAVLDFADWLHR